MSCGQRRPNAAAASATAVNGLLMGIFAAQEEVLLFLQCRLRFSYLSEADAFLSANCRFPATLCHLYSLPLRLFSRKISSVMRVCSCAVPLLLLLKADCCHLHRQSRRLSCVIVLAKVGVSVSLSHCQCQCASVNNRLCDR